MNPRIILDIFLLVFICSLHLQLSVTLAMKGIRFWIPFIYKKNHNAYLIHLYGAYSLFFATNWWPDKNVTSIRNAYAIHLEKIRQIHSEKSPCEKSKKDIDMEGCLQQYMESQINCSIPWGPRNFGNMDPCQTEQEFEQYRTLAKTIKYLGEPGIYEKTGCKSNCDVMRYEMKKRYQLQNYPGTDEVRDIRYWQQIEA